MYQGDVLSHRNDGATDDEEVQDFVAALRRTALSFVGVVTFVLGEWALLLIIGNTLARGDDEALHRAPLSWIVTISTWAVALVWGAHVLAEAVSWIVRHLRR